MSWCQKCNEVKQGNNLYCSQCGNELIIDPTCPKCGEKYEDGIKCCKHDGNTIVSAAKLILTCIKCGKRYDDGTKFCPDDGGEILPSYMHTQNTDLKNTNNDKTVLKYMSLGKSIAISVIIVIATIIIGGILRAGYLPIILLILCSAIWALIDAKNLDIKKYNNGTFPGIPNVVLGIIFLWIVFFPLYLTFRSKIKSGILLPTNQIKTDHNKNCKTIVKRISKITYKKSIFKIIVDNENISNIRDGQQLEVFISPGKHRMYVKLDWFKSNIVEFEHYGNVIEFECGINYEGEEEYLRNQQLYLKKIN